MCSAAVFEKMSCDSDMRSPYMRGTPPDACESLLHIVSKTRVSPLLPLHGFELDLIFCLHELYSPFYRSEDPTKKLCYVNAH